MADPDSIADLALWLAADDIPGAANNDPVSTWQDKSASANDATQPTSADQPTFLTGQLNSLPAVRFSGDHMMVPNAVVSGATAGTLFFVAKHDADPPAASTETGSFATRWGTSGSFSHEPWTDGLVYHDFGATARKDSISVTPSLASWRIYRYTSAAGLWVFGLDGGTPIFSTATNTVGWTGGNPLICGTSGSVDAGLGHLAEMVFYRASLSTADRDTVGEYLATKYGLTYTPQSPPAAALPRRRRGPQYRR